MKIAVYCENNYDYIYSNTNNAKLVEKFTSVNNANIFIYEKLNKQLEEYSLNEKDVDEVISTYKFIGINYFFKNTNDKSISFSSWFYVKENAKKIFITINTKKTDNTIPTMKIKNKEEKSPLWLKIKKRQYDNFDLSNNSASELISLNNIEFLQLLTHCSNHYILFIFLLTLKEEELNKFYFYISKIDENMKNEFKKEINKYKKTSITDKIKVEASFVTTLYIKEAKKRTIIEEKILNIKNSNNYENKLCTSSIENELNDLIFTSKNNLELEAKRILSKLRELHTSKKISKNLYEHILKKFSSIFTLLDVKSINNDIKEEYNFNLSNQKEKINIFNSLLAAKSNRILALYSKNKEEELKANINICFIHFSFYPLYKNEALFFLNEMMNNALKNTMFLKNKKRFLDFFENLPSYYTDCGYRNIMDIKELINNKLRENKLLENNIFKNKELKEILVLLNYIEDEEYFYYKKLKGV